MHDFGKLVYLDLQKTGSTCVSRFLNRTCTLRVVRESKHERIRTRRDPQAFYFISVRHPLSQYSSLFRYGLDGNGALYERLVSAGKRDLYRHDEEAFNEWLLYMLNFSNAPLLGEGFELMPKSCNLGFLSFRYLMLSIAQPEKTMRKMPRRADLREYAREKSIVNHVLYNEDLNAGLRELATKIKPEYFDQSRVEEFFQGGARDNASSGDSSLTTKVTGEVYEILKEKEQILLSLYDQRVDARDG